MSFKINPYKCFFISVLFSTFLVYIFNSGVIAYGVLTLCGLMVIVNELTTKRPFKKQYVFISLAWLPYVIWASSVYVMNPFEGRYLTAHLLAILILPLITITFFRLLYSGKSYENYEFIYKILFLFVTLQLFVCLGQLSTYTLGFGLPVTEVYSVQGMVTGTFYNSNDLAAVVLVIVFFVLGLEKFYFKKNKTKFWLIVTMLLVLTSSRSAVVVAALMFLLSKVNNLRQLIAYIFMFILLGFSFVFLVNNVENEAFARVAVRLNTIISIFQYGIDSDSSMNVRMSSYLHFIEKLPELGLGSGEINNYSKYSHGVYFEASDLLFQNPHSLVVEIGYWLGWLGLLFFFVPISLLLSLSKRKFLLLFVLLIVSMIPSSILGSMIFFLLIILCFFDFKRQANSSLVPNSI